MKEVVIVYHNHLDPEWARCFERPMLRNSLLLRSYADVWDFIISSWLDMEEEGLQYTEGQYLVWRTYLKRHPEQKDRIRQLIQNHRLEILLQGELTPETNYLPAEGLARNYLLAKDFYDEFCGENYAGTKIAWIWDAFGNSANLPQVLKLAGAEVVGGTKYRPCYEDFWVGIDGTKIPCVDNRFQTHQWRQGGNAYYGLSRHAICKECSGYGCEACGGRGMISEHPFFYNETVAFLEAAAQSQDEIKFVLIGGEEVLPNHCILDAMETLNEQHRGEVAFRFGDLSEYWQREKEYFQEVADQYNQPTEDLNPVHQGCYVTRIENKQRTRSATYALIRAEAELAMRQWQTGEFGKAPEEFTLAWEDLMLNMHHDSISGAHIDGGQIELMDYLDEAEAIARQYLTGSKPVLANRANGKDRSAKELSVKRLGKMSITYDRKGILTIQKDGIDLFGEFHYQQMTFAGNSSRQVRIGELSLQCDWGDNHNAYFLGDPVLLGDWNYAVYENADHIWWRGRHESADPSVKELYWEIRVSASDDGERLDFVTDVWFDTNNKRVRVLFPVADDRKSSVWEIPYGFIERQFDPENMTPFGAEHATLAVRPIGEFPALHWVRHDITAQSGVAILNKGIPSAKWIPGCFELSLLRSPMMTGDTVLPSIDEVWDVDGTRDSGRHRFEYSLFPYTQTLTNADLTKLGYRYNEALPRLPFKVEGDVVVTAFKLAHDGDGFILRLQEANGTNSNICIVFDSTRSVFPVNLMERSLGDPVQTEVYSGILHKHQILTLKIQ